MRLIELISEATQSEVAKMMGGGCYALALYLHKRTGLPLYGLFDQRGTMHHAFVLDGDSAYDARGEMPLDRVHLFRGQPSQGTELKKTTPEEVQRFANMVEPIPNREIALFARSVNDLEELINQERINEDQQTWPVLYHGSEKEFTRYNARKGPHRIGGDSYIYTTTDPELATAYGPVIYRVEPTVVPNILDLTTLDNESLQVMKEFYENTRNHKIYRKWSWERFVEIIQEGRMFVRDEYGPLQSSLLKFCFGKGYNCVIIPENVFRGSDITVDKSWVFNNSKVLNFYKHNQHTSDDVSEGLYPGEPDMSPPPKSGPITSDQAALIIANDDELFHTISTYVADYPDIFEEEPEQRAKMISILSRIKPFVKRVFRGEPEHNPETERNRGFSSWSSNTDTAQNFAQDYRSGVVRATKGLIQGVSLDQIITQRMRLRPDESYYSGMQAEWFVLTNSIDTEIIGNGKLIYEARQEQVQMYHGTSDVNLRSILKHGLLADPPDRNYQIKEPPDSDTDPRDLNYHPNTSHLYSFGGVYLTSTQSRAMRIASVAAENLGGEPLIVEVTWTKNSGYMDEDDLFLALNFAFQEEIRMLGGEPFEEKSEDRILTKFSEMLHDVVSLQLNKQGIVNAYTMIHYIMNEADVDQDDMWESRLHEVLRWDDRFIEMAEAVMRNSSFKKDGDAKFSQSPHTTRLTRNIGFRGRTRISRIYYPFRNQPTGETVWSRS